MKNLSLLNIYQHHLALDSHFYNFISFRPGYPPDEPYRFPILHAALIRLIAGAYRQLPYLTTTRTGRYYHPQFFIFTISTREESWRNQPVLMSFRHLMRTLMPFASILHRNIQVCTQHAVWWYLPCVDPSCSQATCSVRCQTSRS